MGRRHSGLEPHKRTASQVETEYTSLMIWLGLVVLGLIAAGLAINLWWPLWGWGQDPLPKPPKPPIIQSGIAKTSIPSL